jgi:hypothetical protein
LPKKRHSPIGFLRRATLYHIRRVRWRLELKHRNFPAEQPFRAAHGERLTTFVVSEWYPMEETTETGEASAAYVEATTEGGDAGAAQVTN